MSKMSELAMEIESAIADGILSFDAIAEKFGVTREDVESIYDGMCEYADDGQPDEAQEWYDFDPDC